MKKQISFVLMGLSVTVSFAAVASDCIIDPQKVMVHVQSEPLFIAPDEKAREVASQSAAGAHYARKPDEYLDVLKTIPSSEPKVSKAWMDYKIMKED